VKVLPGGSLTLSSCTVDKSGDTGSTEGSGFYGYNSGVLVSSSSSDDSYTSSSAASLTMTDCTVTTSASGANGVFAFGEGATATLDNLTITTTGDSNSGGVDATYGGTIVITDSILSTTGASSAALRSDRYDQANEPSVTATNCTATSAGSGSPAIYSTATYAVYDSTLTATGSEGFCIEGLNSITLDNCTLSGADKWGGIIYQSMSGDSTAGTGTFSMTDSTMTNNSSGPMFMSVNTEGVINLENSTLIQDGGSSVLVRACAASDGDDNVNSDWGSSGSDITMNATSIDLEGTLSAGTDSTIVLNLSSDSTWSGSTEGSVTVNEDATSLVYVTADSAFEEITGIEFDSDGVPVNIDAPYGVTITVGTALDATGLSLNSGYTLGSGGILLLD
jgi:hypothetical protein